MRRRNKRTKLRGKKKEVIEVEQEDEKNVKME